jgi:DNA-binding NarL/FixJ family response regulator
MPETGPAIRVLIVDDHPAMREGLRIYIQSEEGLDVVGEAADGIAAVEEFLRLRPDVVLMDLQMQVADGLQAISAIRGHDGDAKIVVLTTYPGEARAARALALGACSYLLKSASLEAIVGSIRASFEGRRIVDEEVAAGVTSFRSSEQLSPREAEVMRWIAEGSTNSEIARTLHVSEQTIKSHVKSIFAKLRAHDRTHAVALARRQGLLEP